jgi:hypothetical protein
MNISTIWKTKFFGIVGQDMSKGSLAKRGNALDAITLVRPEDGEASSSKNFWISKELVKYSKGKRWKKMSVDKGEKSASILIHTQTTTETAKYWTYFEGVFDVVCVETTLYVKGGFWGGRWLSKLFGNNIVYVGPWLKYEDTYVFFYEAFFVRSKKTGCWYYISDSSTEFFPELHPYLEVESYWNEDKHILPVIGTKHLDQGLAYEEDVPRIKDCFKAVYEEELEEERRKKAEEKVKAAEEKQVKRVAEQNLKNHLADMLIDKEFVIDHIETRDKIKTLILAGHLELEEVNLSSLGIDDLVREISNRLPEEQRLAFSERTQELLNAYTSTQSGGNH